MSIFPKGELSRFFRETEYVNVTQDSRLWEELIDGTRNLIYPIIACTELRIGILRMDVINSLPLHTIFARRDRNDTPYSLTDLANDLEFRMVSRLTIDEPTEKTIRSLAATLPFPRLPRPMLVEDSAAKHYLLLDGNKRFAATAISARDKMPHAIEVFVGRCTGTWSEILSCFGMKDA
ncbi:MAG: hypothetical protein M3495_13910 [Pseudomonadota bacterium]|nr:hypothetical protein [Pseudomonadota bacterium]